jgi:hypothetical protein
MGLEFKNLPKELLAILLRHRILTILLPKIKLEIATLVVTVSSKIDNWQLDYILKQLSLVIQMLWLI